MIIPMPEIIMPDAYEIVIQRIDRYEDEDKFKMRYIECFEKLRDRGDIDIVQVIGDTLPLVEQIRAEVLKLPNIFEFDIERESNVEQEVIYLDIVANFETISTMVCGEFFISSVFGYITLGDMIQRGALLPTLMKASQMPESDTGEEELDKMIDEFQDKEEEE
ncbi:MAG: hypothetical protein GF414_08515 [Candidatus Altiarchaeales archaeon]|nr:hypothetical protein [Candidatus Altiarchaeales archaeon]